MSERTCRWCRRPTVNCPPPASEHVREAHCANPQCDWCLPCVRRREAAFRAGKPDLLDGE